MQLKKIFNETKIWNTISDHQLILLRRRLADSILPVVFIAWFIFLSFSSPVFFTSQNLFNVTRQIAVIGVLSIGQLVCMISGNIDLSVGTFLGMVGALLAGLSLKIGFLPAFMIVLLITLLWGLMNGFLVSLGKGTSVIITLSTMYIARGITLIYTDGKPFILFPMPYQFLGSGNIGPVPWSLITLLLVAVFVGFILHNKAIGRHIYAVGGNREAARVCGINPKKITIYMFVVSAFLSALGSIILLGRVASAQPNAGIGMELDSIAAVLIGGASVSGGAGTVIGTLIGILMLGLINNGLNLLGVSGFFQFVLKGLIILLAVLADSLRKKNV